MDDQSQKRVNGMQHGTNLTDRIHKTLIVLICGVFIIFVLECTHMLRSSSCYSQQGYYNVVVKKDEPINEAPSSSLRNEKMMPLTKSSIDSLSISSNSQKNEIDLIEQVDDQITRQLRLREFCYHKQTRMKAKNKNNLKNIFYSDRKNVIYCSVPKVACTNWKRVLQVFEEKIEHPMEIDNKEAVHTLKYSTFATINATEVMWRKNLYYSFLFVRHPLERLLSAYRNKLQDPYNSVFQRSVGSKILKLYRVGLTEKQYNDGKNVTFKEFINYVIQTFNDNGAKGLDEHWRIIHSLCNPCTMKYNFVGKMETLVEDAEQVLKEVGADKLVQFPSNATDKYQVKINELMKKYYSSMPAEVITQLYEIYEDDFVSFGYDLPSYV